METSCQSCPLISALAPFTLHSMSGESSTRAASIARFDKARWQARLSQVSARLRGRDLRNIPFDAIRSTLRQQSPLYQGIQEVPVDRVVGSVGRYKEFTRKFLPLSDSLKERWVGVDALAQTQGWPPIELYQVGDVYFVQDGNHRLSVAQQLEMTTIEAHVWRFPDEVSIDPEERLDDMLIRLEVRSFMAQTELERHFPDHMIHFTSPGRYTELLAQIADLQEKLSRIDGVAMPYSEAVCAWYDMVYLPTIQIIHDSTLLKDFPERTEADLFVWLSQHRAGLQETLGAYENLADLARMLAEAFREDGVQRLTRQVRRLFSDDPAPLP